jgi:F-type H+-transporting ATPase subunit b
MPQLSQLPVVLWSQLFWLAIALGFIFFVIARGMVPKIQKAVDDREKHIAGDLEAARLAREQAQQTEAEYRERIDASRGEAMKLAQAAKQAGAREVEERTRAVDAEIAKTIGKAETQIRKSLGKAMAELDEIAVEASRELVSKLTGENVPAAEATRAVKAVLHG